MPETVLFLLSDSVVGQKGERVDADQSSYRMIGVYLDIHSGGVQRDTPRMQFHRDD